MPITDGQRRRDHERTDATDEEMMHTLGRAG